MRPILACAVVAIVSACKPPELPVLEFETTGGCGDITFFAVDAADEVMLSVRADGLIDAAQAAGEPVVSEFDLPDDDIAVRIEEGDTISDAMCDDLIENGGPDVERTWKATSGHASITVRPGASEFEARADLHLEDVEFTSNDDAEDTVTLEELDITDVSVGWFAG